MPLCAWWCCTRWMANSLCQHTWQSSGSTDKATPAWRKENWICENGSSSHLWQCERTTTFESVEWASVAAEPLMRWVKPLDGLMPMCKAQSHEHKWFALMAHHKHWSWLWSDVTIHEAWVQMSGRACKPPTWNDSGCQQWTTGGVTKGHVMVQKEAQHDQVTNFCFANLTAEMGKWSVTDSFSEQNKTNQSRKMDCLEGSVEFHTEKAQMTVKMVWNYSATKSAMRKLVHLFSAID